jgi:hypothetical protein
VRRSKGTLEGALPPSLYCGSDNKLRDKGATVLASGLTTLTKLESINVRWGRGRIMTEHSSLSPLSLDDLETQISHRGRFGEGGGGNGIGGRMGE